MPAAAESRARMPVNVNMNMLLTNRTGAPSSWAKSRAKMLDLTFKPPVPAAVRRAHTLIELQHEHEHEHEHETNSRNLLKRNSLVACSNSNSNSNGFTSRLLHRQRMERLLKPKEVAKAFSSPSVLASKPGVDKMPFASTLRPACAPLPVPPQKTSRQRQQQRQRQRQRQDDEDEDEDDEQKDYEDEQEMEEKKLMIVNWLYEADFSERPPTPPSRFEDYVELAVSPVQVETAIHIIYAGDS